MIALIAFVWLYLVGITTTACGLIGLLRDIARTGSPSLPYVLVLLGGLTFLALVHVLWTMNSNVLLTHTQETRYIVGSRDFLYTEINGLRKVIKGS